VTRMRAGLTLLISAALLAAGVPATNVLAADLGPTSTEASGTTGAQSATTCPQPRLSGLPKRPKVTHATIHFKLTNMTVGASYLVRAGGYEVYGGGARGPTVKNSFLLPDQGPQSHKIAITAVVDTENCANAPWKLQKQIHYKAVAAATPAAPAAPPASNAPATPAKPAPAPTPLPAPVKPVKVKPVKPVKLPWQVRPHGTPLSLRTYMAPLDGASRLLERPTPPKLSRLERQADTAKSNHALVGLGLVGALFIASTLAGLWAFVRRDEIEFEAAMSYQLKHLDEGDFSLVADEAEPEGPPLAPTEEAPFADPAATPATATAVPALTPEELVRQHTEVEQELQRILTEAGVEAELQGILAEARDEAERQGVAFDTDLMLQVLCDELNGSAKLSDVKREQLRAMFATIIAEETQTASAPVGVSEQEASAPAATS
jgi:hypothetical protein